MKKLHKQAGFTLAELLIVVAIIAILVAIGIPAFSTAMERSRETVDLSNIRGAYAEFMVGEMSYTDLATGYYQVDIKQKDASKWIIDLKGFSSNIKGNMPTDDDLNLGEGWIEFSLAEGEDKPSVKIVSEIPEEAGVSLDSGDGWELFKKGE